MRVNTEHIKDHKSYPIYLITRYTVYLAFCGHLLFLGLFIFYNIQPLIYMNIFSCLIFFTAYILNSKRAHRLIFYLTFLEMSLHAYFATYFLGWTSGFHLYILCLLPLIFNYRIQSSIRKKVLVLSLLLLYVSLNILSRFFPDFHLLTSRQLSNFDLMNVLITFVVFVILSHIYSISAMHLEADLREKNKALETSSRTDPLTGLSNRRDILEKIEYEKERIIRNKEKCCFILTDIDNFKLINDNYGHDFGDYVLSELAGIFKGRLRNQDHICRWGGEEFLFVLPDTDVNGGVFVAQKIRNILKEYCFKFNNYESDISLTFGVSLFDPHKSIDTSIKIADELLYYGKRNGRDRIEHG